MLHVVTRQREAFYSTDKEGKGMKTQEKENKNATKELFGKKSRTLSLVLENDMNAMNKSFQTQLE